MPALPLSYSSLLLPWEISPTVIVTVAVVAVLYARGAGRTDPPASMARRGEDGAARAGAHSARSLDRDAHIHRETMNWSVVLGDLPFWWLVLDPRPWPLARVKQGWRILMLVIVMPPMMAAGAILGLSRHDRYLVYEVCGRFLPISPITDQQIGGLVVWIAGGITTSIVFVVVIARMLGHEKRAARIAAALRLAKPALTK